MAKYHILFYIIKWFFHLIPFFFALGVALLFKNVTYYDSFAFSYEIIFLVLLLLSISVLSKAFFNNSNGRTGILGNLYKTIIKTNIFGILLTGVLCILYIILSYSIFDNMYIKRDGLPNHIPDVVEKYILHNSVIYIMIGLFLLIFVMDLVLLTVGETSRIESNRNERERIINNPNE